MKVVSIIIALILCVSMSTLTESNPNPYSVKAPSLMSTKVSVYTTAKGSEKRLSPTHELRFTQSKLPLESEISLFINPDKHFQTVLGIGGAITYASAEVFAQLPPQEQEKLLTAYYPKNLS